MQLLVRSLIMLVLLAPMAGQAVTLGEARVKSFLNQPLDAEIPLIGLAEGQNQDLRLRIANQRHFDRLGIAYTGFIALMKFDVVRVDGRWVVRARSDQAVTEPFLDFPLQMSWPGGQLIKQYTLLLDPPTVVRPARAARVERATPQPAQARTPAAAPPAATLTQSYGPVRSGETLWPIAKKLKPQGITTRQMAMALLRANPQAFIDGNVNRLKAGATLSIPARDFIEQMDAATARAEFAAQVRRWQAPVATSPRTVQTTSAPPASRVATTPPTGEAPAAASADEMLAAEDRDAQLRIVTEQEKVSEPGSEQDLKEQLLVTMEEIESNRITTDAIEGRLSRLEAELDRMQKLVELKDAQIEALQAEVSARDAIQQAAQMSEPALPEAPAPTLPGALDAGNGADISEDPRIAAVAVPPPVQATDPVAAGQPDEPTRQWYDDKLWVLWVLLALLGLTAIALMFRRTPDEVSETQMAGLPRADGEMTTAYRTQTAPPATDAMEKAAADFRALAKETLDQTDDTMEQVELPEIDVPPTPRETDAPRGGLTNSLLDTMLDENKLLDDRPEAQDEPEFTDDDIASWVAELDAEVDRAEGRGADGANDEGASVDDIPSILTELDDQLTAMDATGKDEARAPGIQLEPLDEEPDGLPAADEAGEDDTFTMSLDLARAYLEIGDRDGARDMLNQALAGARDPEHRRQIEKLLQQIG